MAKKKKKPVARKKAPITERPASKEKVASRRLANKRSLSSFGRELDLELLIKDGIPDNDRRTEAYGKIYDEAVSLTWIAEVLSEVTGTTVTAKQVIAFLSRRSVSMRRLRPEDEFSPGPFFWPVTSARDFGKSFYVLGYPRKTKPDSDTFIHPKDMAVLEGIPRFSKVKKHPEWVKLKKARSHIS